MKLYCIAQGFMHRSLFNIANVQQSAALNFVAFHIAASRLIFSYY